MNALFRLLVGTIVVLLVMNASYAQIPVASKLQDSVALRARNISGNLRDKLRQQKNKLISTPPISYFSSFGKPSSIFSAKELAVGTGMQRIGTNYNVTYSLDGQVSIFRIPLKLQLNNNQNNSLFDNPLKGNLFKAGFNREEFLKSMVPELGNYSDLKSKVFGGKDASSYLRQEITETLAKATKDQARKFKEALDYINQHGNIEELLKIDQESLRRKLASLLSNKKDSLIQRGSAVYHNNMEKVSEEQPLLDTLIFQVINIKEQLEANGISPERLKDIEKQELLGSQNLNTYISKNGLNKLKKQGWEGLLSRLSDLEMGSFGEQLPGSFMNKDVFMQGGSVSINTTKGILQIGLASRKDIGFTKDAGFTNSNFNLPKLVTFLSIPVIGNGYSKGRISWTGSIEKQSYRVNERAGISPRSGSALTLSQELGNEKMGKVTFELSKSAAAFRNVGQIGVEHVLLERNSFGNYFKDDLVETMAFGVKYDVNKQKSRLNSSLFFNYSGIGFQNPSQQGFGNMGLRMGGSLRKGFLKNKVLFNIRGDLKNTPVSGTTDAHWQNHNLNMEARFKLSTKFNFSVKYMDNGVYKSGALAQSVYGSKKYQFDLSSSYKLFKKSGFSHLVAGLQQMNNPVAQSSSQFLTTIYTQSLSLGTVSLMGNLFYNRELGKQDILGDMVSADAAVQYRLLEKVSASTGLTYLDNTGQARQMGIKQNAQFSLLKNMEVNFYADIRKNMIAPLYPELFASNQAEVSLKYYFR